MDVKPLLQGSVHGRSVDQEYYGKPVDIDSRPPNHPDPAETGALPPVIPQDVFEKSPSANSQALPPAREKDAGGLRISMNFDLFYKLSQKVTARMGQSGGERFAEVTTKVAETFKGKFSLSIDPVGSYLKGTDKSLEISPETASAFFDAVEGLADQSPEALEGFLKASDDFFNELESKFGEAGGAFDELKAQVQNQATQFFQQVTATREQALTGAQQPQILQPVDGAGGQTAAPPPPGPPAAIGKNLIPVVFGNNPKIVPQEYQDFLKSFIDYVKKFQEQTLQDFFKMSRRADPQGTDPITLQTPTEVKPPVIAAVEPPETNVTEQVPEEPEPPKAPEVDLPPAPTGAPEESAFVTVDKPENLA